MGAEEWRADDGGEGTEQSFAEPLLSDSSFLRAFFCARLYSLTQPACYCLPNPACLPANACLPAWRSYDWAIISGGAPGVSSNGACRTGYKISFLTKFQTNNIGR